MGERGEIPAKGNSSLALDCGTEGYRYIYFQSPKLPASSDDSFAFGLLKKFSEGVTNLLTSLPFINATGYIHSYLGMHRSGTLGRQKANTSIN